MNKSKKSDSVSQYYSENVIEPRTYELPKVEQFVTFLVTSGLTRGAWACRIMPLSSRGASCSTPGPPRASGPPSLE